MKSMHPMRVQQYQQHSITSDWKLHNKFINPISHLAIPYVYNMCVEKRNIYGGTKTSVEMCADIPCLSKLPFSRSLSETSSIDGVVTIPTLKEVCVEDSSSFRDLNSRTEGR